MIWYDALGVVVPSMRVLILYTSFVILIAGMLESKGEFADTNRRALLRTARRKSHLNM